MRPKPFQVIDDPVHDELLGRGLIGSHAARLRRASRAERAFDFASWFDGGPVWWPRDEDPIVSTAQRVAWDAPRGSKLSELPELATVEELVTRPITIDASTPNLRSLFIDGIFRGHEGDLSLLPALEALHDDEFRGDYSRLSTGIRDLAIVGRAAATLPMLPHLERLALKSGLCAGSVLRDRIPAHGLRWLDWAPEGGAAKVLREQERLEVLDLDTCACSVARLSLLGPKPHLERAVLMSSGLRSLEGIEHWSSLRELLIYRHGGTSLAPLAGSPLEVLRIYSAGRLSDGFDALGELPNLRALRLDVGTHLDDVSFLRHAEQLQVLMLEETTLGPRAFDALVELPNLRIVTALNAPMEALDRLETARPEILVAGGRTPEQLARLGRIEVLDVAPHGFSIFTDLARRLGVGTNYDVERVVAQAMPRELRAVIGFDSEAGNFCANAPSREPLEELRAIIERLIAERSAMAA